jgi:hypothetical protein
MHRPLGPCATLAHSSVPRREARYTVSDFHRGPGDLCAAQRTATHTGKTGPPQLHPGNLTAHHADLCMSPTLVVALEASLASAVATARRAKEVYLVFCNLCERNGSYAQEDLASRQQRLGLTKSGIQGMLRPSTPWYW